MEYYLMTTTINGTTGVDLIKDGSVAQADLSANVAGNGPAFSVYISANQVIPNSTWTRVAFNTKQFDTANAFDMVNCRFQPLTAGYYIFGARIGSESSTGVSRMLGSISKNGLDDYSRIGDIYSTGGVDGTALIFLNGSTDYVELKGYIVATTALFNAGAQQTFLHGYLARSA
jgi:hypothetical protein